MAKQVHIEDFSIDGSVVAEALRRQAIGLPIRADDEDSSVEFDASGLCNLAFDLDTVPKLSGQLTKVAVKKTAKEIESTAETLAPVDIRFLWRSNMISTLGNDSPSSPASEVRANAEYAFYQESGTSRLAPKPFMVPAVDCHTLAFEAAMPSCAPIAHWSFAESPS